MLSQIMLLSAAVWSQLLSLFHSLASSINFTCAEVLRRIWTSIVALDIAPSP